MRFTVRQIGALVIAVAAVAPVAAVWAVVATDLAMVPWADDPMTPSQAVVRRDFAQAIRLIEAGAPVTATYASPTPEDPGRRATPMDEAIRAGKVELVRVLLDLGAASDAGQRLRYACAALARQNVEIVGMVMSRPLQASECDAFRATPPADMVSER